MDCFREGAAEEFPKSEVILLRRSPCSGVSPKLEDPLRGRDATFGSVSAPALGGRFMNELGGQLWVENAGLVADCEVDGLVDSLVDGRDNSAAI